MSHLPALCVGWTRRTLADMSKMLLWFILIVLTNQCFSQDERIIEYIDSLSLLHFNLDENDKLLKVDSGVIEGPFDKKIIGRFSNEMLFSKSKKQILGIKNENTYFNPKQEQLRIYWFHDEKLIKVVAGEIYADSSVSRTFYYDPKTENLISHSLTEKDKIFAAILKEMAKAYLKQYRF
jgi:hypothetical protein